MKRKCISLVVSLLILVTCITPMFGAVSAQTIGNLSYSADVLIDDFKQDFDALEARTYSADEFTALTGLEASINTGEATYTVTEDGVAEFSTTSKYSTMSLSYNIPSVQVGTVVAQLSFLRNNNADNSPWSFFSLYGGGKAVYNFQVTNGGETAYCENVRAAGAQNSSSLSDKSMYHYTLVVSRPDTASDWAVVVYDTALSVPRKIFNRIVKAEDLARIEKIALAESYSVDVNELIGKFDDVSIQVYKDYVDFNQNFDSVVAGTYTAGQFAEATNVAMKNDDIVVAGGKATISGDQEVKVFIPGVQTGLLETSFAVSPATLDDNGSWNIFSITGHKQLYSGNIISDVSSAVAPALIVKQSLSTADADTFEAGNSNLLIQPTLNEETGMYSLRAKIYRTSKDEDWTVKIVDDAKAFENKVIYTGTLSEADFESITEITLLSGTVEADATLTAEIDDISVKYTKVSDIEKFSISQDFENIAEGAYEVDEYYATEENFATLTKVPLAKETENVNINVVDGKLNLATSAVGAIAEVEYELPMSLSKGTIEARIKMSVSGTGAWEFFSINNGEFTTLTIMDGNCKKTIDTHAGDFVKMYFGRTPAWPEKDADGMVNLRMVASRPDENSDWYITIYDESLEKGSRPSYTAVAPAAVVPVIDSLQIINGYSMGDLAASVDEIEIRTYDIDETVAYEEKANFNNADADSYSLADFYNETGLSLIAEQELNGMPASVSVENGKVKLKSTGANNPLYVNYYLPEKLVAGTVITKFKIESLAASDTGSGNLYAFAYGFGEQKIKNALQKGPANVSFGKDEIGVVYDGQRASAESGMIEYVGMISRRNVNSDWNIYIYDRCPEYSINDNYHMFYEGTVSKEDLPAIDMVRPISTYPTSDDGMEVVLDDFEMQIIPLPDKDVISFTEEFNDDFDFTGAYKDAAYIYNSQHRVVIEGDDYNNDDRLSTAVASNGVATIGGTTSPYRRTKLSTYLPKGVSDGELTAEIKFKNLSGAQMQMFHVFDDMGNCAESKVDISSKTFAQDAEGWSYAKMEIDFTHPNWAVYINDGINEAFMGSAVFATKGNYIEKIMLVDTNPAGQNPTITIDSISLSYSGDVVPPAEIEEDGKNINIDSVSFYADGQGISSETLPAGTQEVTAGIFASNTAGTKEYFSALLGVYSAEGRLLGIGAIPNNCPADGDYYEVTASGFTTEEGATVKLFFMNYMSVLSPLRAEVGLSEGF